MEQIITAQQLADQESLTQAYSQLNEAGVNNSIASSLLLSRQAVRNILATCLPIIPGSVDNLLEQRFYDPQITLKDMAGIQTAQDLVEKAREIVEKVSLDELRITDLRKTLRAQKGLHV